MEQPNYILAVNFYRTDAGNESVRDWLKELPRDDKRIIGEDIKTVQLGWPLGIPLIIKWPRNCGKSAHPCRMASHGFSLPSMKAR